jgi:hypothetical protein
MTLALQIQREERDHEVPEAVDQGAAEKDPVAAGEPPEIAPETRVGWGIGIHGKKNAPLTGRWRGWWKEKDF